jgi:hypothetical protein
MRLSDCLIQHPDNPTPREHGGFKLGPTARLVHAHIPATNTYDRSRVQDNRPHLARSRFTDNLRNQPENLSPATIDRTHQHQRASRARIQAREHAELRRLATDAGVQARRAERQRGSGWQELLMAAHDEVLRTVYQVTRSATAESAPVRRAACSSSPAPWAGPLAPAGGC